MVVYKLFEKANSFCISKKAYYHYQIRQSSISFAKNFYKPYDIYRGNLEKFNFISQNKQNLIRSFLPILISSGIQSNHYLTFVGDSLKIKYTSLYILEQVKNYRISIKKRDLIDLKMSKTLTRLYIWLVKRILRK